MNKALTFLLSLAMPLTASASQFIVTDDYQGGNYNSTDAWYNDGILVNWASSGEADEIILNGRTIKENTYNIFDIGISIQGGFIAGGGDYSSSSNIKINDSYFIGNTIIMENQEGYYYGLYGGIVMATNRENGYDSNYLIVKGSLFKNNTATLNGGGTIYGGVTSVLNGSTASFDNVTFDSNRATATSRVQGGVLHVFADPNYNQGDLTVTNSTFKDNSAEAGGQARGAAIENYNSILNVQDSLFEGNSVKSTGTGTEGISFGGALFSCNFSYIDNGAVNNLKDVTFTNNSAQNGYGGAVALAQGAVANFVVTKNTSFSGNYATNGNGQKEDSRGGFLWMSATESLVSYGREESKTPSANFNIAAGTTLTIGTKGINDLDSIASNTTDAEINKLNDGLLIVNSSMAAYTGSLNVSAGEMQVLNLLGASEVKIYEDASLILLAGGFTEKGHIWLDMNSSLSFILGEGFDESSVIPFYLAEAEVTLNGFEDINDVVSVKYYDSSDYAGSWTVSLDSAGILFSPNSIPEPSTYAVICAALAFACVAPRKRKQH